MCATPPIEVDSEIIRELILFVKEALTTFISWMVNPIEDIEEELFDHYAVIRVSVFEPAKHFLIFIFHNSDKLILDDHRKVELKNYLCLIHHHIKNMELRSDEHDADFVSELVKWEMRAMVEMENEQNCSFLVRTMLNRTQEWNRDKRERQKRREVLLREEGITISHLFARSPSLSSTIPTARISSCDSIGRIALKGLSPSRYEAENLIFGTEKHKDMVYLIDFGLSKRYIDTRTGVHVPFRTGKSLRGTPRYISIGAHIGMELDRRDDLESLCSVLLYLLEGTLPWVGINCSDATSKYRLIGEMKLSLSSEVLCAGAPLQLCAAFNYTKALQFGAQPDDGYLRHLFSEMVLPAHYSGLLLAGTVQSLLYYEFSGLTGFGKGKAGKVIFGGLGENGGKTGRKLEEGATREGGRRLNSRERKEDEKRDHKKGISNTNPFRAANTNVSQRVILNQNQLSGFQDLVVSQRTGSSSFDTSSGGTSSIDRPWSLPHLDVGLIAGGSGNGGKSGGWEKTQFPTSSSLWRTHTLADESNAARNSPLIGKGKMMHGSSRSPIVSHKQLHSFSYASSPKKAGGKRMLLNEQEGKNNRRFDRTHSMDDPDSTSRSRESEVAARRVSLDDGWLGVGKDELDGSSSLDFGDGDGVVKRGKGGVGGSRGRDDGEGSREVLLPSLFKNDEFGGKGMNGSSLPHLHGLRRQSDRVDEEEGEVGKKGLWKLSGSGKEEGKDVVGEGGKEREKERGMRGVGQAKTTAHLSLDRNPGNRRRRISEAMSGYALEPQKGGRTNESGVGRGVITMSPQLSKSALGMGR
ncbi:putative Casein kinase I [Blattamonas nauphoetae]|uniref:Casein kinase I n=1 Tax=Blattamonas nauphoetae TaxID=2049346 RepID=A0ABQ9YBK6_9EUKA|nr:putative Casein kinase I [Blattamonas nauphoetae]